MRALTVSIWIFINLVFFGMCGYMYLLWSQYWMYIERQSTTTTSTYDQQIYYYNRGVILNVTQVNNKLTNETIKSRTKHSIKENRTSSIIIMNSRPRFPNIQERDFEMDTKKYDCSFSNATSEECTRKSREFKDKILKELRRVLEDESNVLKMGPENPYNVQFEGKRRHFMEQPPDEVLCKLRTVRVSTLKRGEIVPQLSVFLARKNFFENRRFNSCAVVASAGSLKGSKLGPTIDAHDLVLRFNNAPTKGFENDVGRKTTIRVLNSQIVTRSEFNFTKSDLYKNVTIVIWDPSDYNATLNQWLLKPEYNLFPNYVEFKKNNNKARIFVLNPLDLWQLWDFLQSKSPSRLRRNPLSSGFLGLSILLPLCNYVDIFEYIPSIRVTKRCHYYDSEDNPACTFGVWHPLAAEKLLVYHVNIADDKTVFQKGFVRVPGFPNLKC